MEQSSEISSFGALLRSHRLRLGLSQEVLAERAGLSRRGIADLERGARLAPYAHTVERLAHTLGLSNAQRQSLMDASRRRPTQLKNPATAQLPRNNNLPSRASSFVGREREQVDLAQLLTRSHVVTLVGPGGVGKTRLALQVAGSVAALFSDGVWLVELAQINDAQLVLASVAAVLGIQQAAGLDSAINLTTWLRSRDLLLVLDNCEHLVEACADLVSQIAHTCPDLHVLATSREPLGVEGETIWRVDPLTLPSGNWTAESVRESEAVRLFVDRALAAAPDFRLTERNAAAVVTVCCNLDGIPLALELVAPRLRTLSVENVAERLDQRFELLTSGSRDALPRHRTLRALVDWSFQLLNDAERAFFAQLSAFVGGWTLDAADAVCGTNSGATLDLMGQLVDKSLIQVKSQPDGSVRYAMLETLRQYADEQLLQAGQSDEVHQRHALFYAYVLERRWGRLWIGENTRARMASVARDYENFRASLRWLLDHDEMGAAAQLAADLNVFWALGGRVQEGRDWQEQILDACQSSDELKPWRLRLAFELASLEAVSGYRRAAYRRLHEILPAIRDSDDTPTAAAALGLAASMTWYTRHDLQAARRLAFEAIRVAQTTCIGPLETLVRQRFANILVEAGQDDAAEPLLLEDATKDWWNAPRTIIDLARVHFRKQNYAAAETLLNKVAFDFDPSRTRLEVVLASTVLSWVRLAQGDMAGATEAGLQAVALVGENQGRSTSPGHLPGPLEALAMVAAADHQPTRALRLAAAAASLRDAYDEDLNPNDRAFLERWLEVARLALGPQASADAWAAGQALDSEDAMAEALSIEAAPDSVSAS